MAAVVTLAAGLCVAVPTSAVSQSAVTIPDSHPSWANPSAKVADLAPGAAVTFRVYLRLRGQAAAESLVTAVSDPSSASYGHYLTPEQVKQRFAADGATVSAVTAWLRSAGIGVRDVAANNAYVEGVGTAVQVNGLFKVKLGTYTVGGARLHGTDRDLSVATSVSSSVLAVTGLNQSLVKPATAGPSVVPPPAGFRNAQPCGAYYGQKIDTRDPAYAGQHLPYAPCGYVPAQLRSAYGIDKLVRAGIDGRGQTIAIVDAFGSPTLYADAAEYARRNDPTHPLLPSQFSQIVAPPTPGLEADCGAAGWYGEQTLDVEAAHGMAPGAHILYVGGTDCQDSSLDASVNYIVANRLADVVSNSYGDRGEDIPASDIMAFHQIAIEAALEGIGLNFSSGDSGDEAANIGQPEPDFSASDPLVTAVGGTSLGINAAGSRVVETGWETGKSTLTAGAWTPPSPGAYLYGSGGGTSRVFAEPSYQVGVVPDSLAAENQTGTNRGRVVPDISMVGDPNTGMLIGITQTFPDGTYYDQYRIGGTSLASPLFTGVVAVANQLTHADHGFLNPRLYSRTRSAAIRDITHAQGGVVRVDYVNGVDATQGFKTSARAFDFPNLTIHTTPGYDNVTGLGVPNGAAFLALL
ncbi:MAG: S53 family peptidase [Actinomycetota bacterium]|nr:S53 family peptidase [Actinomycetota bacterium]